jgi:hypothetical protein
LKKATITALKHFQFIFYNRIGANFVDEMFFDEMLFGEMPSRFATLGGVFRWTDFRELIFEFTGNLITFRIENDFFRHPA